MIELIILAVIWRKSKQTMSLAKFVKLFEDFKRKRLTGN